jgi:hypothetical protein
LIHAAANLTADDSADNGPDGSGGNSARAFADLIAQDSARYGAHRKAGVGLVGSIPATASDKRRNNSQHEKARKAHDDPL